MDIKTILRIMMVLFLPVSFCTGLAAQDCTVVHEDNGTYIVTIDGKQLFAVPREKLEEAVAAKKELETAKAQIARMQAIIDQYETRRNQAGVVIAQKDEIIKELKAVAALYEKLVGEYKKIKEPRVTAELGVGVTGDTEPAVMVGLGFKKFRVFGFLQKENAGAMVGLALPIF
jgi:hypothetical protein